MITLQEYLESPEVPEVYFDTNANIAPQLSISITNCDFSWRRYPEQSSTFGEIKEQLKTLSMLDRPAAGPPNDSPQPPVDNSSALTKPLLTPEEKDNRMPAEPFQLSPPIPVLASRMASPLYSRPLIYDEQLQASPGKAPAEFELQVEEEDKFTQQYPGAAVPVPLPSDLEPEAHVLPRIVESDHQSSPRTRTRTKTSGIP
jgi:hypothetical protein